MNIYRVIGLMSGTSLDGVDIAYCEFKKTDAGWSFEIVSAETVSYAEDWKNRLRHAMHGSAAELAELHCAAGRYFADCINAFIAKHALTPDFIASHGHTIFHQPSKKFTMQVGDGASIAALTGYDVVCDFRSKDVALGGQGAPLVPAGDVLLFSDYRFCLNLGGIANITVNEEPVVAFDICPANMPLNEVVAAAGMDYDKDGMIAKAGNVNEPLLQKLNALSYYRSKHPKSLGREWYESEFAPLLGIELSIEDKLHTLCEHIGMQVAAVIDQFKGKKQDKLLVTGGGAFNPVLTASIKKHCRVETVIPARRIIEFKEAMIFAFLGVLFMRNENNVLSNVTGSRRNHTGGAMYKK